MGLKERFLGLVNPEVNPEGIKIERKNYSPSGELPLPLALKRAKELKKRREDRAVYEENSSKSVESLRFISTRKISP